MSKLYRARSLLYRRQILQQNIRWKALDEIYKIYMLLHRSDFNIFFEDELRKDQAPAAENKPVLGREKDCVIFYLEAQSGKIEKREP